VTKTCDKVDVYLFKQGMSGSCFFGYCTSSDPYFYRLLGEGWTFLNSSNGGSFFHQVTHNLLTNNGASLVQLQMHSQSYGGSSTPTAANIQYLAISPSTTAPSATDTVCNSEITIAVLTRSVATITAGTASSGSISPVLTVKWTAGAAYNNIQLGCAYNVAALPTSGTGTTEVNQLGTDVAELTFSSVNLSQGDQLTLQWTFQWSG
jgi:hypothetical protein